ncbi:MAG: ribonuclease P protein component [Actinobacteria bacterium]|nr:ribonuclease P protein component [Actinomycetota bacterium]
MIDSIRYRWEFAQLRSDGQYRRSGPIGLRWIRDGELPAPRVAFAIGKGVGNAVQRNRIRRRLRELLRSFDQHEQIVPGRYLFIVSQQATTSSFDDLRTHLSRLIGSE